jgi:hypothetical protein
MARRLRANDVAESFSTPRAHGGRTAKAVLPQRASYRRPHGECRKGNQLHPPTGRVGNERKRVSGEGDWNTDGASIHPPRRPVPRLRPSQRGRGVWKWSHRRGSCFTLPLGESGRRPGEGYRAAAHRIHCWFRRPSPTAARPTLPPALVVLHKSFALLALWRLGETGLLDGPRE